jgi:hypothetical protein
LHSSTRERARIALTVAVAAVLLRCNGLADIEPATVGTDATPADDADSDASGEDGAGGGDATGQEGGDAFACVKLSTTALPPSGGAACPADTSGCYPHATTTWSSTWVAPIGPKLGVCSAQQITGYYDACRGPGETPQTCKTFADANASCVTCMESFVGAPQYGVVVVNPDGVPAWLNYAGCLALVEPCNLPCAQLLEAALGCSASACSSYCAEGSATTQCETDAVSCTACESLVDGLTCYTQVVGPTHPAYQTCGIDTEQSDPKASFTTLAQFLCGS